MVALRLLLIGQATFYGAGIMDQVYDYRVRVGDVAPCAECVGKVALLDPFYLGSKVWLDIPGHGRRGPFLVTDCGPQDLPSKKALQARNWAVDLDWDIAQSLGMNAPIEGVKVWIEDDTDPDPEWCLDRPAEVCYV